MPQAKADAGQSQTGNAQGRFTVQLPADVRPKIEALGKEAVKGVKESMGIDIELGLAQIVAGVINAQHEVLVKRQAAEAKAKAEPEVS